jgi:hypothetical protein
VRRGACESLRLKESSARARRHEDKDEVAARIREVHFSGFAKLLAEQIEKPRSATSRSPLLPSPTTPNPVGSKIILVMQPFTVGRAILYAGLWH